MIYTARLEGEVLVEEWRDSDGDFTAERRTDRTTGELLSLLCGEEV